MSDVKLLVKVDRDQKKRINELAATLATHGMTVERTMWLTGMISGVVAEEKIEELRHLDGISELREEGTVTLSPPDDDSPK